MAAWQPLLTPTFENSAETAANFFVAGTPPLLSLSLTLYIYVITCVSHLLDLHPSIASPSSLSLPPSPHHSLFPACFQTLTFSLETPFACITYVATLHLQYTRHFVISFVSTITCLSREPTFTSDLLLLLLLLLLRFAPSFGDMSTLERAPSSMESNALLKDLYEKKQNIRRIASEVGSMASELRDVRGRMASQELSLEQEISKRQAAEAKAKNMERELESLHKSLEETNAHAISTASVAEQYLRELVDVRAKLGSAQETADASATSAVTAQLQCTTLMREIEIKNEALQEHEVHAIMLGQQLMDLQQELRSRETSQKQLKDEVERLETEMKLTIAKVATMKDSEMKNSLEELSVKSAEQLAKHLSVKDEEITRLREEIKLLSAQLKIKAQELEAQMEKHRAADQDLKKRVIKLEFWLQEARTQTRKLQRIAERREKELKDLRAQLASNATTSRGAPGFWGSPRFKIFMSVSAVVLVFFAKR